MLSFNSSKKIAGIVLLLLIAAELLPHFTPVARGETFKALSSDSADYSCQVVLRSAQIVLNSATGLPETETDNQGQSWFAFEATVDTASAPLKSGASLYLLYRLQRDSTWHTAPGVAVPGASATLQRHQFRISSDTIAARNGDITSFPKYSESLQVIPFLQSSDGRRIFDHNSQSDLSETYTLGSANIWKTSTEPTLCERAGRGSATLRFLGDWSSEHRGEVHPGQSLLVEYDLSRLPNCQGSSYNGLPAWQTEAFVRFFPNGEEYSSALSSFQSGTMLSLPARFEVPEDATRAQLWFRTRGRGCEGGWDSNFGRDYVIDIRSRITSSPTWAGQWQVLKGPPDCSSFSNPTPFADTETFNDEQLENACYAIEAEVLVPGLTTSLEASPQAIQAQVNWKVDAGQPSKQWLTYAGRNGSNYRYRWILPAASFRARSWKSLDYSFQFSTDGLFWLRSGKDSKNSVGVVEPRRIEHKH